MDIVEFLLARLDEDQAAGEHLLEWMEHPVPGRPADTFAACMIDPIIGPFNGRTPHTNIQTGMNVVHVADPARVLAEVKAKRWMLAAYERCVEDVDARPPVSGSASQMQILWHLMRQIAAPYADHADYNRAWAI